MKIPFVKEWGSWAVFFTSCAAGLIAGLLTRPWEGGREYSFLAFFTIAGLTCLINSKLPLAAVIRSKGKKKEHIVWLLVFFISGLLLMIPFLPDGLGEFWIFSLLIISYALLLASGREHHLIAELNGFAMLTLSAPIVYYAVTGAMSWQIYIAVSVFFAAGVFKVRVRTRKTLFFRWVMILYCLGAVVLYYLLKIPVVLLLPLAENVVTVIRMQEEKLKTTGYTELAKGVIFIILIAIFWQ
jgi:hypothetical protein